jgi:SsrA-binding protein
MQKNESIKTAASNRKAFHDYFVEERYEAGIELFGTEVKSIRAGTVNLKDSYLIISDGELFAKGIHISPYEKGNIFNRDPLRERKLLMHKKEILKLRALTERDGYTLVPLSLYFKKGRVKVEVGVCRGKKLYDKRESALKRDLERENRRGIKLSDRD